MIPTFVSHAFAAASASGSASFGVVGLAGGGVLAGRVGVALGLLLGFADGAGVFAGTGVEEAFGLGDASVTGVSVVMVGKASALTDDEAAAPGAV
jgi:hypothetical protein